MRVMKLKIIKDLIQGSDEWLKIRLGVATASNFSKIITSTGEPSKTLSTYALELASEKLLTEPDSFYQNDDMIRGNELEGEAREKYQEFTFNAVDEVGFMSRGDYGYSPDGTIGDDADGGLIEIKCPKATTHTKYLADDKMPTAYIAQVQGGMFVSGRKWCDFVSYHPNFKEPNNLFIKRVLRNEDFMASLLIQIVKVITKRDEILKKIK